MFAAESTRRPATPAAGSAGVTTWLPYWEMPAALASTLGNADVIGTASPYWFTISGESTVHFEPGAGAASVVSELQARGVKLVPMVTEAAGMAEFARIAASPKRRAAMVHALVSIAAHDGYAGLDLDFESLAYDPKRNGALADRVSSLYPVLVGQACAALHAIGRTCEVAVMPRTSSAHVYGRGDTANWVYDYGALARAADRIQVMAYDDHSPGGTAGPIAPLPWVRQVIAYARSQSPPARDELGVPAYGYDWYGSTSATAVNASQVDALAKLVHARIHWDPVAGEATFKYRERGRRHTVWLDVAASDYERATLARAAGFSGIAIWAAGYEQPALWPLLRRLRVSRGVG